MIGNWICKPIMFKNPLKTNSSMSNVLLQIVSNKFGVVIWYFLFDKQTFNGLLKVIGIQMDFKHFIVGQRHYKPIMVLLINI